MKGNEANWARRVSASATWHYRRGSCEVDRAKCAPNRRAFRRRDNNFIERQIKPWAMGRKAWLFCGSELAGQRAAIVMSLVQSAKLNGHDPWAYLRDVLERLPSHPNSRIDELLPHRWSKPDA